MTIDGSPSRVIPSAESSAHRAEIPQILANLDSARMLSQPAVVRRGASFTIR
jgi:hypothetical protein